MDIDTIFNLKLPEMTLCISSLLFTEPPIPPADPRHLKNTIDRTLNNSIILLTLINSLYYIVHRPLEPLLLRCELMLLVVAKAKCLIGS